MTARASSMSRSRPRSDLLAAICLALWLPLAAAAQDRPEASAVRSAVVVVDQDRLFDASLYGQRVLAEIDRRTDELAAENRKIEAKLTAEERALTELRAVLSVEEFRSRAEDFNARVEALRAQQDAKVRTLGRLRDEARQEFYERAGPILSQILFERGASVLMDRRAVLSAAEGVDITDVAIMRIDAAIDDGTEQDEGAVE